MRTGEEEKEERFQKARASSIFISCSTSPAARLICIPLNHSLSEALYFLRNLPEPRGLQRWLGGAWNRCDFSPKHHTCSSVNGAFRREGLGLELGIVLPPALIKHSFQHLLWGDGGISSCKLPCNQYSYITPYGNPMA